MLILTHAQILLIKMDQIKGIFKASIAKDPFDVIFWSDPNKHTYKQAISLYNTSNQQQKQQIQQRIIRKLSKPKQSKTCLSSLLILHYLLGFEARVNPQDLSVHPTLESIKSEKSRLAQEAFLKFYLQFLKSEAAKQMTRAQFDKSCLADQIRFCQIAVESIMTVIKFDFVILHALNHLEHKQIRQIAVRKVIEDVAINLSTLKHFINENWQKILQQGSPCFQINQIYEKCLYFSKQSQKLTTLRNKIKLNKQFEFYVLNSETNKQIEQQMVCKQEEKKQYMSQKYIRSKKNIGIEIEDRNFDSCPDIISEDSILLASFDI